MKKQYKSIPITPRFKARIERAHEKHTYVEMAEEVTEVLEGDARMTSGVFTNIFKGQLRVMSANHNAIIKVLARYEILEENEKAEAPEVVTGAPVEAPKRTPELDPAVGMGTCEGVLEGLLVAIEKGGIVDFSDVSVKMTMQEYVDLKRDIGDAREKEVYARIAAEAETEQRPPRRKAVAQSEGVDV